MSDDAPAGGGPLEVAILIGLPGAGKSTFYARRLAPTHAHVSMDALPKRSDTRRRQRQVIFYCDARADFTTFFTLRNTEADPSRLSRMIYCTESLGTFGTGYLLAPFVNP